MKIKNKKLTFSDKQNCSLITKKNKNDKKIIIFNQSSFLT